MRIGCLIWARRHLRGQTPVLQRPNNPTANSYGNLTSSLAISF